MKKAHFVVGVSGILLVLALGILVGYFFGSFSGYRSHTKISERQESLQNRTEAYYPSCEELRRLGNSRLVKRDKDYFFVSVSEEYFVVFGFNAEPGKVPVTAWWGASRKEALRQACDEP